MTSSVDRDRYICDLYAAGWSAISIGAELGLSRSQVHRIVAAGPPDDDDDDDDDDDEGDEGESALDVEPMPLVEPVTFCGKETAILPQGRGEEPKRVRVERWTDARDKPVNDLHFYRYRQSLRERDPKDVERFDAELDRQRREYEQRRRISG